MNLFVCPIFLLWSKGLFNITEKKTITELGNEPRKKRTIKTYKWDVLYSKWFQCVLDDESEGSLYPLFIDQSTSPSSSAPWLASFLMFPKLTISIYWKFALWSIYGKLLFNKLFLQVKDLLRSGSSKIREKVFLKKETNTFSLKPGNF